MAEKSLVKIGVSGILRLYRNNLKIRNSNNEMAVRIIYFNIEIFLSLKYFFIFDTLYLAVQIHKTL
jgi:hypothetical protein